MKSLTRGNIKMALGSVRATRWRSLLTIVGVVIGIASVVTVVSLGEGIKRQLVGQINHFGKDLITVRPGNANNHSLSDVLAALNVSSPQLISGLSDHDLSVVQNTPGVQVAVPLSLIPGTIAVGSQQFGNIPVIGSSSGIPTVLNQTVQYGDFFTSNSSQPVSVVIGASLAQRLFNETVPLGQSFNFDGQSFIVGGIMNAFNTPPFSLDIDYNNAIFIPYSVAEALNHSGASIYEILVKPRSTALTNQVTQAIRGRLLSAHGGQADFSVLKPDQSLAATSSVLDLLTRLISAVAAISLFVGGVGIMNIMLVSVSERTHEIGIRKAIGATNRQILAQFLIEATVLSLCGGLLGVIGSLFTSLLLRIFTNFMPVLSWPVMALAVGVSLIVGIIFGVTPAIKAARKDPIDALRHE